MQIGPLSWPMLVLVIWVVTTHDCVLSRLAQQSSWNFPNVSDVDRPSLHTPARANPRRPLRIEYCIAEVYTLQDATRISHYQSGALELVFTTPNLLRTVSTTNRCAMVRS
ncbi:hypothetical protein BV20DRAFT_975243 [Pilatotrama ljubarskyi]|nr:hypothetical protein BV20DRAFT_975243 [Pilatotrama ljubarskyi]